MSILSPPTDGGVAIGRARRGNGRRGELPPEPACGEPDRYDCIEVELPEGELAPDRRIVAEALVCGPFRWQTDGCDGRQRARHVSRTSGSCPVDSARNGSYWYGNAGGERRRIHWSRIEDRRCGRETARDRHRFDAERVHDQRTGQSALPPGVPTLPTRDPCGFDIAEYGICLAPAGGTLDPAVLVSPGALCLLRRCSRSTTHNTE